MHAYFICLPACLPIYRKTHYQWEDRDIFLSQYRMLMCKYKYRCVVLMKIYPLRHGESFHLSLLLFFLTVERKGEKSLKRCWWIVTAYINYVTRTALCTLHHCNKCNVFNVPIQVSQESFMLRLIYMCVCSRAVICQYSWC